MAPSTLCGRVEDQLPRQHLLRYRDLERLEDLPSLLVDLTNHPDGIVLTGLYAIRHLYGGFDGLSTCLGLVASND